MVDDDDDINDLSSSQQDNEENDYERLVEFLQIIKNAYSFYLISMYLLIIYVDVA